MLLRRFVLLFFGLLVSKSCVLVCMEVTNNPMENNQPPYFIWHDDPQDPQLSSILAAGDRSVIEFKKQGINGRKETIRAMQISGIAEGIKRRWPKKLSTETWGNILSYLYGRKMEDYGSHLPKKLWFNLATSRHILTEDFKCYEQLSEPHRVEYLWKENNREALSSDKTVILSINGSKVRVYRNKKLIYKLAHKYNISVLDGDTVHAELSKDGTLLKIYIKKRIRGDICDGDSNIIESLCFYDLENSLLLREARFSQNWNTQAPTCVFTPDNKIIEKLAYYAQVWEISLQHPFTQTSIAQRALLHRLHQSYAGSKSKPKKVSFSKISKKNKISYDTLRKTFDSFNESAKELVIETYNVKIEPKKEWKCIIQ